MSRTQEEEDAMMCTSVVCMVYIPNPPRYIEY